MIAKYRSKPANIEAMVLTDDPSAMIALSGFIDNGSDWLTIDYADRKNPKLTITTPNGDIHGSVGDYIVKFDDGDTYLYSAENFNKAYEAVE